MENIIDTNIDAKVEDTKVDEPKVEATKVEDKTFTQEQVNVMMAKRIEREKKNAEIEKEEAKRLATMSEADRKDAEREAEKAKLVEELVEERKQHQVDKLEFQIVKELSDNNLGSCPLKYFKSSDTDTVADDVKEFKLYIEQEAQKIVTERLRGNTPKSGSGNTPTVNPWKEGQINLTAQGKIWKENPELARTLMNNN